mmetsp:Transcript_29324/g.75593  ORF Transcript_29324/g.75593 Transcript_29324/m.75593 type:complete len:305 (-) Transcript_29324:841-1755(-)
MAEDIGVIAKIILTIIGVPIFILGLYFLIYTDPAQRDTRVSAFNLAVDEWDNHTSSLFDHVSISVSVGEGTNAVVLGKQTEFFDTQSHNVFGHPDASTSAFTSIRYEHSGVIGVLTSSYPFSSEGWATAMFNVTDTQTGLTSTFSLQLPTTSVKHVAGNRKVCLHQTGYAYWDSSRSECLANNMLTDVCVRLSRTSDGYIQGGASGTGAGCAPARNWYPFSFSHLAQDVTEVGGIGKWTCVTLATLNGKAKLCKGEEGMAGKKALGWFRGIGDVAWQCACFIARAAMYSYYLFFIMFCACCHHS